MTISESGPYLRQAPGYGAALMLALERSRPSTLKRFMRTALQVRELSIASRLRHSWFKGRLYVVGESTFDEWSLGGCEPEILDNFPSTVQPRGCGECFAVVIICTALGGSAPRVRGLEETNSISSGGYAGASNSFAAALWALDYYCYMAYNTDVAGLNIHVGGTSAQFNIISPVIPASRYILNGPGYGLFAFAYNGQGKPLPVTLSNSSNVNLTAYGLVESNGTESMHIINRTYGGSAVDATVKANPGKSFGHAQIMYLKQTNNDVSQNSGITLGGQPVNSDGTWSGGYTLTPTPSNGAFTIPFPHTQAAIVHFY